MKGVIKTGSEIDLDTLRQEDPVLSRSDKLNIQWIGHSSFLVQINGLNILTDPVVEAFHPLLGGMVKAFKRYIKPGISLENLPKIDVVLISHNHFDHLEDKTLLYLKKYQPEILVPQGLKKYFEDRGFEHVEELRWWDDIISESDNKEVKLYAVPARHSSMARGGVDRHKSLWCGWVIEAKDGKNIKNIYFAGDTAFDKEMFKEIREKFYAIDLALLPIAPAKMMDRHMDNKQALEALNILKGKAMIPMHWGAYRTGDEKVEDPYLEILKQQEENPFFNGRIKILKIGQRYSED